MIKRRQSPDSGIEPETSGLPGSVLTFTPNALLRNPMIKLLKTQVNTMMYDLRCNAGGARPIKVRLGYGTRPRAEHIA